MRMREQGEQTRQPGPCVLVVDDDSELLGALAEGLTQAGYAVLIARDGLDAFDAVERLRRPDAILLDLSMPGMNGWEFLEELREDPVLCHIPVIVLTGYSRSRVEGADAVLTKPLSLDRVLSALSEEIARAAAPQPL
jgi:CheY-like chemotaxis protein